MSHLDELTTLEYVGFTVLAALTAVLLVVTVFLSWILWSLL